ncbi:ribosomal-protein-alanine acetyltransferase [Microbacterium resistens]|uniref:Ribosomal-protein-alanine acetyltransferase n=1 Tax=Microbacterium resistens TaxID=156977 RepID=A0ABU1SCJ1_9MICO|nr:ribosomal protein S18-alanine N-acetyltransferase [Microbacterium resistens]MDR6867274.1 ribosomal-protein-alanine acetyltransferase [Microbacterium resistens]
MIRPATPADLAAIMALEHAAFPGDAWSEQSMSAELAGAHGHYVVDEEDDGRVVGYAGLRAVQGSRDADIQTIAIDAAHRGEGRGRGLLRALVAVAAERGAREVFLDVRADNMPAIALYASEGFEEIGRRPRYYRPDGMDAIVMKAPLTRGAAGAPVGKEASA